MGAAGKPGTLLGKDDRGFKASPDYIVRIYLKQTNKQANISPGRNNNGSNKRKRERENNPEKEWVTQQCLI